jgi:hypothetical protein
MHLNEWGLGGRGFGTFVTWFLLGGDIYSRSAALLSCRPGNGPTPPSPSAPCWPCSCNGTPPPGCSPPGGDVIRRNAAMLPAYSLVLGLIALFGYMARAVPAVNADVKAGGGNPSCPSRCCSCTCSPAGSRESPTRRSSSARSSPRPSCRLPRRTCLPALFTRSS